MVERATTGGQPNIPAILLRDMRQNVERLGSLIERRKRLGALKGDIREVEEVSIGLDADAIDDSRVVLNKLAKRFE